MNLAIEVTSMRTHFAAVSQRISCGILDHRVPWLHCASQACTNGKSSVLREDVNMAHAHFSAQDRVISPGYKINLLFFFTSICEPRLKAGRRKISL